MKYTFIVQSFERQIFSQYYGICLYHRSLLSSFRFVCTTDLYLALSDLSEPQMSTQYYQICVNHRFLSSPKVIFLSLKRKNSLNSSSLIQFGISLGLDSLKLGIQKMYTYGIFLSQVDWGIFRSQLEYGIFRSQVDGNFRSQVGKRFCSQLESKNSRIQVESVNSRNQIESEVKCLQSFEVFPQSFEARHQNWKKSRYNFF